MDVGQEIISRHVLLSQGWHMLHRDEGAALAEDSPRPAGASIDGVLDEPGLD
jgi:hypothetical protein